MLHAAICGQLEDCEYDTDPVFGLRVPRRCPRVPSNILMPRNAWENTERYDGKARHLAGLFRDNFARFKGVPTAVAGALSQR